MRILKNIIALFKSSDKQDNTKQEIEYKVSANPYQLIWYKQGWSDKRIAKNNDKFWDWEAKHGNLSS